MRDRLEARIPARVTFAAGVALALGGCVSLAPVAEIAPKNATFFEFRGQRIHYVERGTGPLVILVHGFGGSTDSWRHVMPALAAGHRVVAVDLFGFGLSPRPRERHWYSRTSQTELLAATITALGEDSAHFVGHSYGGGLVQTLAWWKPEAVRSFMLVNSTAAYYSDARRHPLARPPFSLLYVRGFLRPWLVRRSLARSFFDDSRITPALVERYLERLRIRGAARAYAGLTAPSPPDPRFAGFKLEALSQPALVIWGDEDDLISADHGKKAADRLLNGRFVTLPDCGHIPMEEKPSELVRVMTQFLAGRARPAL